jgi:adenylate kinase family enzyme
MAGRRIVIWGATGSGKTTLSRRLGALLGLAVVELDAIRHAEGWDSTPWDEFRRRLSDKLDALPQGWVCDGSYSAISDIYLSSADTVVWLHLPWRTSFRRLLVRTVTRAWSQEPVFDERGPRESWRLSFLSSKSILWWSISHHRTGVRTVRQRLAMLPEHVRVYELRSPREVDAFFEGVKQEAESRGIGAP